MISFTQKGDFSKTEHYLKAVRQKAKIRTLEYFGRKGVEALSSATPVRTGLTASSWYYEIEYTDTSATIRFNNSNVQKGWYNVALMIEYGHGTRNGGWVEGTEYVNQAIIPILEKYVDDLWEEVRLL